MRRLGFALIFALGFSAHAYSQDVPPWVREAAAPALPSYGPKTPAAVLLNEERIVVDSDGRITRTAHRVTRLLSRDARGRAVARSMYMTDSGKVRSLNAWLLRPSQPPKKYDTAVDVAAVNNDIYNEVRMKVISASDDSDAGSVFAYESVTEERSVFTQLDWEFQDSLPVLVSRLVLTVPSGWNVRSLMFNHTPLDPVVTGSTYTWEIRALPHIEHEPAMPSADQVVPRLAISFFPLADRNNLANRSFASWQDVSQWLTELNDPQATTTEGIVNETRRLTSAATSSIEKVRAIAKFVQGIQYISIQTGIGRGGGYKPHAASDVFAKSYGDCKDKANLMRSMLRAVGITSYPVSIYSGDRSYVREEWPSPQQFNHAIIAIAIADPAVATASIEYPTLERLLFFDPTDPDTSVGDLPEQLQGSFALVIAGNKGGLIRMPTLPADQNQLRRQTDVTLSADGSIAATMEETSRGQAGATLRAEYRLGSADFFKRIERWIASTVPNAAVSKTDLKQNPAEDAVVLTSEFKAAHYAQIMNNKLMVFKPVIVNRGSLFSFEETTRKYPIVTDAAGFADVMRFTLPEGFKVDETPDPVSLSASFGNYSARFEMVAGALVFTRSLSLQAATIPPERYAEVRTFFQRITTSENAPVVLIKR